MVSPYKGLDPFSDRDARFFFGRDRDSRIVAAHLQAARLSVVYGESGVGKSSLLRAGVVNHLRTQARRDLEDLGDAGNVVVEFSTWQADPLEGIAAAIETSVAETYGELPDLDLRRGGTLEEWIASVTATLDIDLLFIFDQFEELFLYHGADHPFMEQFPDAVNREDLRANFLLALREDRIAKLDRFRSRIRRNLLENALRVEHLDSASARLAITAPVEEHNRTAEVPVTIEPALVDAVLAQVPARQAGSEEAARDDRIETPLLQLVMARLWDEESAAGSTVLRRETLDSLGGAEQIARTHLEAALDALPGDQQATAADLFRFLVTRSGSKIAHDVDDLVDYTGHDPAQVQAVLHHLSDGGVRILRTVPPAPGRSALRYEIFHDVLAPAITEWRTRFDEKRGLRERARKRRRRVLVAGLLLGVLAVAAGVTIVSLNQARHDALYQLHVAEARGALDPQDAMRSALAALDVRAGPEAETELRRAVSANRLEMVTDVGAGEAAPPAVNMAAYDAAGERSVVARNDGTALVVDMQSGAVLATLAGHEGNVLYAGFSPDGDRVVTTGSDGTARIWSADGDLQATLEHPGVVEEGEDAEPPLVGLAQTDIRGPDGAYVATGAFSADGTHVVTWAATTARVWDLASGDLVAEIEDDVWMYSASFAPDGSEVITSGDAGMRIWDLEGNLVETLGDGYFEEWLWATVVTFDPSGEKIVAGHNDGSVSEWDRGATEALTHGIYHPQQVTRVRFSFDGSQFLSVGERVLRMFQTETQLNYGYYAASTWISDAAFSPDNLSVAVAEGDGTASVLSASSSTTQFTLRGHQGGLRTAAYAPGGDQILTASEDGTVRVWSVVPALVLPTDSAGTNAATFDGTGDRLVHMSWGDVMVRDSRSGAVQRIIGTEDGTSISSAGFDRSGTRIVDTTEGGTAVSIWDLTVEDVPVHCCDTGWTPWTAGFLEDDLMVVGYWDDTIRLWEPSGAGWEETHVFDQTAGLTGEPDAAVLVTATREGTVHVWDRETLELLRSWSTGRLGSFALSKDGSALATSSIDGDITVWDVATGESVVSVPGDVAGAGAVRFTADGSRVASGGADGTVSMWSLPDGTYLGSVHAHAGRVNTIVLADDDRILTSAVDGTARVLTCEVCEQSLDEVVATAREMLLPE